MLCALVLLSTLLCGMLPASADDTAPLTEEWISAQLQSAETVEERIAPLFADGAPQPDTPWPELHVTAVYPEHSLRFFYADEDTLQAFYNLSGSIYDTYPVSGKAMWAVPFEADSAGQAMLGVYFVRPRSPYGAEILGAECAPADSPGMFAVLQSPAALLEALKTTGFAEASKICLYLGDYSFVYLSDGSRAAVLPYDDATLPDGQPLSLETYLARHPLAGQPDNQPDGLPDSGMDDLREPLWVYVLIGIGGILVLIAAVVVVASAARRSGGGNSWRQNTVPKWRGKPANRQKRQRIMRKRDRLKLVPLLYSTRSSSKKFTATDHHKGHY